MPQDAASAAAQQMRATARDIFLQALGEASIARAFDQHVEFSRGVLRIADDLFDFDRYTRVQVIAVGKAAHTMLDALTARIGMLAQGIVAAPTAPPAQTIGFRYFLGGHPVPNDESARAAGAILRTLHAMDHRGLVIYLLSGGGSSVVEKAVDDDISLTDVIATYRTLVHSSAPIAEINAIRKHLSAVKGGRLAEAAAPAQQVSIMVSDVPEHALDALASGPTMPDSTTVEDCHRIAREQGLLAGFPDSVRELFEKRALEETPKKDHDAFHNARWWPILSNVAAQKAAAAEAARHGFAVEVDNSCDDWDHARAADYLLDKLRTLRQGVSRACLISGGEVTVKVDGGGTGGRNQQFALYCTQKIAGENIAVLSAGTDGIDGNSPAAGAVADGTTLARAHAAGLDLAAALREFNAFPLFETLGDAIITGPTGNNVRDLRVLLAY
jgi:hydroxypyruvate reductase